MDGEKRQRKYTSQILNKTIKLDEREGKQSYESYTTLSRGPSQAVHDESGFIVLTR